MRSTCRIFRQVDLIRPIPASIHAVGSNIYLSSLRDMTCALTLPSLSLSSSTRRPLSSAARMDLISSGVIVCVTVQPLPCLVFVVIGLFVPVERLERPGHLIPQRHAVAFPLAVAGKPAPTRRLFLPVRLYLLVIPRVVRQRVFPRVGKVPDFTDFLFAPPRRRPRN